MDIKPIKTERDYERAVRRAETLLNATEGSAGSDELDVLATLLEAYEREHYPIDMPDPVETINFRLEQEGKNARALEGVIGLPSRVHDVMQGNRALSVRMIRALNERFGIPVEVLIQPGRQERETGVRSYRRTRAAKVKKYA